MIQTAASSHYSFRDTDLAAERLTLLAQTYERGTLGLLDEVLPSKLALAIDLGCGLGYTSTLLAHVRPIERVAGYERSTRYLAKAKARFPNIEFVEQDVLNLPYPDANADLVYSRFLLTHLHEPQQAILRWMTLLKPKGLLVLEEVAHLASPLDEFQEYYALVAQMQTHYAQELYVGRKLDAFARRAGLNVRISRQISSAIPAPTMARLHAMNLTTWKQDTFMSEAHPRATYDRLLAQLERIAGSTERIAPVTCTMATLVIEA
jgi:SAM-dependent methyltransferase